MDSNLRRKKRKQWLILRDGLVCKICGEPIASAEEVTLDHIIPRASGGTSALHNLRVACFPCNNARGDGRLSPAEMAQARALLAGVRPGERRQATAPNTRRRRSKRFREVVKALTFEEKLAMQKQDEGQREATVLTCPCCSNEDDPEGCTCPEWCPNS